MKPKEKKEDKKKEDTLKKIKERMDRNRREDKAGSAAPPKK
jgi:hypothetical protein